MLEAVSELLRWGVTGVTLVAWALLLVTVLGFLAGLVAHLRLRARGMAEERERLASPLPPEGELPHVVVQLPVFNEGAVVRRAVENAVGLDWPADRLHVQVCDDSTDHTTELARAAAREARAAGFDVRVLHRTEREGFKAGALQAAMEENDHPYFLILDVDYVSPPDFLRRCMAVLVSDPDLAFVQARPDYLNPDENVLARAQAQILDFHYGLEQPTRSWSEQTLPFNGTCGVWRRAAVEAAGGWKGDTLTEDWDLAYRAWWAGWKGIYLASVAAFGELPTTFGVWRRQQRRWSVGLGEVTFKTLRRVVRGGSLPGTERWSSLLPLLEWIGVSLFAPVIPLSVATALLNRSLLPEIALFLAVPYVGITLALLAVMYTAHRFLGRRRSLPGFLLDFLPVPLLLLYVSWEDFRSLPSTVVGRRRIFERTPKRGSVPAPS